MEAQLDYELKMSEVQGMTRFVIQAELRHETDKAILIGWSSSKTIWIPKSQMKLSSESTKLTQVIWLNKEWADQNIQQLIKVINAHKGFDWNQQNKTK